MSLPDQHMPGPLLQMESVEVRFWVRKGLLRTRPVSAVVDVSLTLARGEVLALVGESGSGKTTLGRVSLGLLKPFRVRVLFDGQDLAVVPPRELRGLRRRAQAIFQDPFATIDPYMTVRQTIEEPLLIHGLPQNERRRRVSEVLEQVRLVPPEEFGDRYPHRLSGGQRQRVAIARALTLQPEYVMADEPVSMVDASSRAELLHLLRELRDRLGIAFLYITHDIATARHFAERMAVMYLGCLVEAGPVSAVIDNPLHPYTRALMAAVPEPDPRNHLRQRPVPRGEVPDVAHRPSGCAFHPRCQRHRRGLCEAATPQPKEPEPGHIVSCHLLEQ